MFSFDIRANMQRRLSSLGLPVPSPDAPSLWTENEQKMIRQYATGNGMLDTSIVDKSSFGIWPLLTAQERQTQVFIGVACTEQPLESCSHAAYAEWLLTSHRMSVFAGSFHVRASQFNLPDIETVVFFPNYHAIHFTSTLAKASPGVRLGRSSHPSMIMR